MFSVHLHWWKCVLYSGYFIIFCNTVKSETAANTGSSASFVKLIAFIDTAPDNTTFQTTLKVLRNVLKLNDTELWKCPNNFTREPISDCKLVNRTHCLFFEGQRYTHKDIDAFNHKLQDIKTKAGAYVAFKESRTVLCAKGYLIEDPAEVEPFQKIINKSTQHPVRGFIYNTYFKVNLTIDKPCDENAILKATNLLRYVLHLDDKDIWRCQDHCTKSTCADDKLTLCLFFKADENTIINRADLISNLSNEVPCSDGGLVCHEVPCSFERPVCHEVPCSGGENASSLSEEFPILDDIANNRTGSNEAQTGEGPGTGAIVGGSVGGLAGLAGAVMAGWRVLRKLKKNQVDDTASTGDTTPISPGGIDFEEAPNSVPPAGV